MRDSHGYDLYCKTLLIALTFADKGLETSKTGARVLVDGGKNIAKKGKNAVIDPAKRRLTIIEHQINNHARNPNTQTEVNAVMVLLTLLKRLSRTFLFTAIA